MQEVLKKISDEINLFSPKNSSEVEDFRIKYLGKKGIVTGLFEDFKALPPEQKKKNGSLLNNLKKNILEKIESFRLTFEKNEHQNESLPDLSLPTDFSNLGARHPISIVRNEIIEIFSRIGYTVSEGPEIEDDWHNFTALNFPPEHPARDMQDTFFIEKNPDIALRTHTSSVQVRVMENTQPPIRTISPGRVYRNEAISARAHCFFHQIEGLSVDENISFKDLKQTLLYFAKEMFGPQTKIRLRPSFFPFTEPSGEVDVTCFLCGGKGCNICKHSGWVEILGCGMVDPSVLDNCGIDSKKYTGFAFGMGIERITMLKYQINDLRLFSENDIRFLKQFNSSLY